MITVRKFWTIVFITIALSFSLLAYADTYWVKGNKVKNKETVAVVLKSIEDFGTYARKKPYRNCDTKKVDNFLEEMKQKGF